ncbi:MAG TPA: excinuclease ABC subunit A [Candidatus Jacksonbacteria bacterium]|nr:excinuclease ABC subunit A [Candidatus Jacksonbacteria bacterium]
MTEHITIKGAREHNLKNISLQIPRNKMTVFTGVSGSGKSSLAFDTIFAEGQRRYVESLSAYARQFLGQLQKPDVDEIEGLSPAISIDQKAHSSNPRSTVATITEIYDYLRVLYARIGEPHCPKCGELIQKMTVDEIVDAITKSLATSKTSDASAESRTGQTIIFAPIVRGRKGEYYQLLYNLYNSGFLKIRIDGTIRLLSEGIQIDPKKRHTMELVVDTLYKDDFLALNKDKRQRISEAVETALEHGNDLVTVQFSDKSEQTFSAKFSCPKCGFSFPEIEPRLFSFNSPYGACPDCHGLGTESLFSTTVCPTCAGLRLKPEALSVFIDKINIVEFTALTIEAAADFCLKLKLSERQQKIASSALKEVLDRLQFMLDVGLDYLTLNRKAGTLSGGEAQRIRLASQVGSRLVGALYVLDEPTIGLHQFDNEKLVDTLKNLRDIGNTIIVVEHDEATIYASDFLVDFGPGAGKHGGEIVCSGSTPEIFKNKQSLTCQYLRREKAIPVPRQRRTNNLDALKIIGAREHNLKNLNLELPLRRFVCITGVSGSGKSSLMYDVIYTYIANQLNGAAHKVGEFKSIKGIEYLTRCALIDQAPIGRTPRSNPATYTGVFTWVRDLFSALPESRFRNYRAGRFSFNVPGGRCEHCQGHGYLAIEMHFLPTVYIDCDICKGRRFNRETLEVNYNNKNIAEVLKMTVEEGAIFFKDIPMISDRLDVMQEVGLGYIELGQAATTLSGGEAQRVKLSKELAKQGSGHTFYLLDEPTTGLHFDDVRQLLVVLQKLVQQGHTVVVIEHNLDVIKTADYIIDLGPGGGDAGGRIVATGTPEEVAKNPASMTGRYLKTYLK